MRTARMEKGTSSVRGATSRGGKSVRRSGVSQWGGGRRGAAGRREGRGGQRRAPATLAGAARSGVQSFVTLLAEGGMDRNTLEISRGGVPTHTSALVFCRGRSVTKVARPRTGTTVAVPGRLGQTGANINLLAGGGARVAGVGALASGAKSSHCSSTWRT